MVIVMVANENNGIMMMTGMVIGMTMTTGVVLIAMKTDMVIMIMITGVMIMMVDNNDERCKVDAMVQ